jgi:hypothetical protein
LTKINKKGKKKQNKQKNLAINTGVPPTGSLCPVEKYCASTQHSNAKTTNIPCKRTSELPPNTSTKPLFKVKL